MNSIWNPRHATDYSRVEGSQDRKLAARIVSTVNYKFEGSEDFAAMEEYAQGLIAAFSDDCECVTNLTDYVFDSL